jgi:hypothetical protein
MPTIDELLKARAARQAQAKVQSQGAPTAPKVEPATAPAPASTSKVEPKAEPQPKDNSGALPLYAPALQDRLKDLADEEDYMDVELSAQSLAETMSAVMAIPYPPDVFIDPCVEYASQALENQKRVYMQRVLSGERQSGKRDKKKAVAVAMTITNLDNLFD